MKHVIKEKGVTLIALAVTVTVMLILAGVGINSALGENGFITRAQNEKQKQEASQSEQEEKMQILANEYESSVSRENELPENTKQNPQPAGTEVRLKDSWGTETTKIIKTSNGEEVTEITRVATVYAVSVGDGETVPVPKNFYYVGGNLSNGVIISDNPEDKYEAGKDKTTYDYTTSLRGNQFVWIPCERKDYVKTAWGKQNAEWDNTTSASEYAQIDKYGGFYVARYEAGLASNIKEFTANQKHDGSNQIYNLEGIPQSKAGIVPWNFIDWTHSKANAEKMYNNYYVSSGLITGTQWDVILNTLINRTGLTNSDITTDSNVWGNYRNISTPYKGRLAKADYGTTISNYWTLKPFGTSTSGKTSVYENSAGDLLTTGASAKTEWYHIFDLAGNVWEWTEEDSHYDTTGQFRGVRGGGCFDESSAFPACYRTHCSVSYTSAHVGFHTVLYIK